MRLSRRCAKCGKKIFKGILCEKCKNETNQKSMSDLTLGDNDE